MVKTGIINIQDQEYPALLKETKGAPKKLYYKGEYDDDIFKNCLAVVGSRRLTSYGRRMTELLVSEIAAAGITIVSGFMYGGDEAAHRAAVEVGGRTIAVMPCGIDLIHPEYQEELYQKILDNHGLIISEFEGSSSPALWTYPKRDRIVAGLSQVVLVIEAGLISGTFITVRHAKSFGRKIFAVPGPLTSEVSKGTAQMIKEGAEVVTQAKDIIDFYKTNFQFSIFNFQSPKELPCDPTGQVNSKFQTLNLKTTIVIEQKIIEELKRESLAADDLAEMLKTPVSKISASLSLMQIKGFIKQEGDKYFIN